MHNGYCYKDVDSRKDFHKACSLAFFGTEMPPEMEYVLHDMYELTLKVAKRSVSVSGVQSKLSMLLLNADNADSKFTVVCALGGNYIFKPPFEG